MTVTAKQKIGRLDIPMQDMMLMQKPQHIAKLKQPFRHLLFRCRNLLQRFSCDIFLPYDRFVLRIGNRI